MNLSKEKNKQKLSQKIQFHSYWKDVILKIIKGCIYVGFEQYQNKFFLKIRTKDKKEMVFQLAGSPDDLTNESYKKLIKEITNEV